MIESLIEPNLMHSNKGRKLSENSCSGRGIKFLFGCRIPGNNDGNRWNYILILCCEIALLNCGVKVYTKHKHQQLLSDNFYLPVIKSKSTALPMKRYWIFG